MYSWNFDFYLKTGKFIVQIHENQIQNFKLMFELIFSIKMYQFVLTPE